MTSFTAFISCENKIKQLGLSMFWTPVQKNGYSKLDYFLNKMQIYDQTPIQMNVKDNKQ